MTRYFTHYWANPTWEIMAELLSTHVDGKLARAGSNRFRSKNIQSGDYVFVVTILDGQLRVGGRIIVDKVLDQADAEVYADWGFDIWQSDQHVAMPLKDAFSFTPENIVPVDDVKRLEFISGDSVKTLKFIDEKRLDPQTLRGVRELTPSSATLLNEYIETIDSISEQGMTQASVFLSEGKRKVVSHYIRERNPAVAYLAKRRRLSEVGELKCDVCNFSFKEVYGKVGENYIEAHHTKPISEMRIEDETNLDDIALVCSNCHRMIHTKKPCYTIDEMKSTLTSR